MSKHIRADHEWYEVAGLPIRKARKPRDCDMAEHKEGWEGAIHAGDEYVWLPHAHLNVCLAHLAPEDIINGRSGMEHPAEGPESDGGAGDV